MKRVRFAASVVVVLAVALLVGPVGQASGAGTSHFRPTAPFGHRHQASTAALNEGDSASQIECTANGKGLTNVNLDCDGILPNNEPHIAVDPTAPGHMVASSNDYESCCDEWYTTFNGGATWKTGDISVEAPGRNKRTGSDPVTSFDVKHDTIIHSSLNFLNTGCDGDVVVSISQDGGLHWNTVVEVADGGGATSCEDNGLFNDKEWIVTDNNPSSEFYGRTYLTWTAFFSEEGHTLESPIWEAHSDDGGFTWTQPQEISGSNNDLCTYQEDGEGGECDEDQFSVPTVAPDGTVYVSFINDQNTALWEPDEVFDDQYLMVSSSDGGETWTQPEFIVGIEDGSNDYPLNRDGRQTLTDYQVRVAATQGFVADPTHNGRLYLVFSDNRNGLHDVPSPKTNADVFLMKKPSEAGSWQGPITLTGAKAGIGNDQWFPWVDVSPVDGTVGVIYNDRSYHRKFKRYNATLAESPAGGLAFVEHRVSTRGSHARNSVFFRAHVPDCPKCARFHGDYISIAYGSNGKANMVWTDMRDFFEPANSYLQFVYFARR